MHDNMVQPSARAPETPASAGRGANVAHQTRIHNGQAAAREAKFCGNATNKSSSLLDDLRFHEGSTS
jgi:hypothetical protein